MQVALAGKYSSQSYHPRGSGRTAPRGATDGGLETTICQEERPRRSEPGPGPRDRNRTTVGARKASGYHGPPLEGRRME